MPRSFKLGVHRIKVARPRFFTEADITLGKRANRSRCDIAPPRTRKTIGLYETSLPRSNQTWRGSFVYRDQLVNVIRGLDGTLAREVLFHEIGHAVWDYSGLADFVSDGLEEKIVSTWSQVWLGVMRENPALMTYLLGDDE